MLDPHYYDDMSAQMHKDAADQLSVWPLARANYRELKNAAVKDIVLDGLPLKLICIPSRSISTRAETDRKTLASRPCFLCARNCPPEQRLTGFEGAKGKRYNIQLNPYPILPDHFVIPALDHTPQTIWRRYVDMLRLSKRRPGFTIFYNGPQCGASAPDHFHFQAVPSGLLPLELSVAKGENMRYLANVSDARLYEYTAFANGIFVIKGLSSKSMNRMFYRLLDCADTMPGDPEPRFSLSTFRNGDEYCSIVIFRTGHRSRHYSSPDPQEQLTMSPGTVDMHGYFVTVEMSDFKKMTPELLRSLIDGVTISSETHFLIIERITRTQCYMEIPVAEYPELEFEVLSDGAGRRCASCRDGRIEYGGVLYDELYFEARNPSTMFAEASFILYGPDGGKSFIPGALRIMVSGGVLKAENIIGEEDYVYAALSWSASDSMDALRREACGIRSAGAHDGFEKKYRGLNPGCSRLIRAAVDSTWGMDAL